MEFEPICREHGGAHVLDGLCLVCENAKLRYEFDLLRSNTKELQGDCVHMSNELNEKKLQSAELKKQLRTAQEVINKHVADQLEGLHWVGCIALEDEECDCPLLVPIFEAMKGYEPRTTEDLLGECRECNRLARDCGSHGPIPTVLEKAKCPYNHSDHKITGFLPVQNCPNCATT